MRIGRIFGAILLVAMGAMAARADVKLPALFGDNAVLQRGKPVPVWGWADDGEKVTVTIEGKSASATAKDGKWKVALPALKAGGPFEMTVAGKNTVTLKNILVGEVWVCGGQSNMQFRLNSSENGKEAIAKSANPNLRLFSVKITGADEPADDVKASWSVSSPKTTARFSAVGYYFGSDLQKHLGVPVGLVQSCLGGTNASSWLNRSTLESDPEYKNIVDAYAKAVENYPKAKANHEKKVAEWRERVKKAKAEGKKLSYKERRKPRPPMGPENVKRPGALYNGMIKPLQPYAIAGAIWYQGEANSHSGASGKQYAKLFPDMIADWRKDWGQGDFPFLFVQLPNYGRKGDGWSMVREAQLKTLDASPNTGMVVTNDIGDKGNIHPTRKEPVGERLALAARAIAYGEKIVWSGPLYKDFQVDGKRIVVSFNHVGKGLEAKGGELKDFEIAGADGKFVPAQAKIEGDKVVVWSDQVAAPTNVRYDWKADAEGCLLNKNGLLASPFRTDDLPVK